MSAKTSLDLECRIAGIRFANPLVLASGIWGTSPSLLARAARSGAAGVTAKTCTLAPRGGHRNPTAIDWGHGLLNAMGLPNPGAEEEAELLREASRILRPLGIILIASISADTVENFGKAAAIVAKAGPDLIEVNISCPNVQSEHGELFAASCDSAAAVTRAVKSATRIPCSVKLAPHVPSIGGIARAVAEAGADAITAINTMPGMAIDAASGLPVLANRTGGISGPALKPIALRSVYEIAEAVSVPIIGTGGVLTGVDAIEMIMAGATCVGVGSAIYYRGENAFALILAEMKEWLLARGIGRLEDVRGAAHAAPAMLSESNPPPFPGWERENGKAE
jgi:dihydroorotate dehydrogenase (NAD+) catalytic subunit